MVTKRIDCDIDLYNNKVSNVAIAVGDAPEDPIEGSIYVNRDSGRLMLYIDDGWTEIGSGGGGSAEGRTITFGNDTDTTYTINHNLRTKDVVFSIRDTTGDFIGASVRAVSDNALTVVLNTPPGVDALVMNVIPVKATTPPVPPVPDEVMEIHFNTPQTVWEVDWDVPQGYVMMQTYDMHGHRILGEVVSKDAGRKAVTTFGTPESGRAVVIKPTLFSTTSNRIDHDLGMVGAQAFVDTPDGNVELFTSITTDANGTEAYDYDGNTRIAVVKASAVRRFEDSTRWAMAHTLGRYVAVYVYDDNGVMMLTDVRQDGYEVVVEFSTPTTGTVVIV